jgi:ParB-like chromosome segregation protein Spo0J
MRRLVGKTSKSVALAPLDGQHRLKAAMLRGDKTILAYAPSTIKIRKAGP